MIVTERRSGWGRLRRSAAANEPGTTSLARLAASIPGAKVRGSGGEEIRGVQGDSREVEPGDLFVAIAGLRSDGNHFIAEALRRGAAAVATERADVAAACSVPCLLVADARAALALAAAAFHGHPSQRLGLIGVTGTDGKTTTTHMIHHLLEHSGRPAGLLSTVDVRIGGLVAPNETKFTTPEAPTLQGFLADTVAADLDYAVLEVSSHALALQRVAGSHFDVGVFTNLTPEHLNFHGDLAGYLAAKATLFAMLGSHDKGTPRAAVINADDGAAAQLRSVARVPVVTYGIESAAAVSARHIRREGEGTAFVLVAPQGTVEVRMPLSGRFNVYNWLAASAAALTLGVPLAAVPAAAATMRPPRGRMQVLRCGQPYRVVVDFAHTPNGLEQTLRTLREHTRGRVLAVLGHPGGRDRQNRHRLAAVAARLSDFFIVTGDDPYDEEPEHILDEVAAGARAAGAAEGHHFVRILDRRAAFAAAFARARPDDTVLLAGRGHLTRWVARGRQEPFDDAAVARSLLQEVA